MPKKKPAAKKPGTITISAPAIAAKKKVATVAFQESGHVRVTDANGQRIEDLERPWPLLWAEFAAAQGHDPKKFVLQSTSGRILRIVEHPDGLTWNVGS